MANATTKPTPADRGKKKTISVSGRGPLLSEADLAENNRRTQAKRKDRVPGSRQSAAPARPTRNGRPNEGPVGKAISGVVNVAPSRSTKTASAKKATKSSAKSGTRSR
jgi:hypothetical protein